MLDGDSAERRQREFVDAAGELDGIAKTAKNTRGTTYIKHGEKLSQQGVAVMQRQYNRRASMLSVAKIGGYGLYRVREISPRYGYALRGPAGT